MRRGGDIFSFLEVAGGEETGLKVSISGVKRLPQVRLLEAYCLFFFWLIITLPCLLLIFEYLLICLGWIMKATYCLLKHNLACMFTTVNLSMFCSYCENGHSCIWCYFSHLNQRRFTDNSWCEAFFEDLFTCFLLCPVLCFFSWRGHSYFWIPFNAWVVVEGGPKTGHESLYGSVFSRSFGKLIEKSLNRCYGPLKPILSELSGRF